MTFPELHFLDTGKPASIEELDQFENRHGLSLPAELRSWLTQHSGAMLGRENYFLPMEKISGLPCSVGVEYTCSLEGMAEELELLEAAFPPKHLPFGHDGDGNYLLMSPDGGIHFWDYNCRIDTAHQDATDECTLKIANSLPAFLSMIGPGPLTEED